MGDGAGLRTGLFFAAIVPPTQGLVIPARPDTISGDTEPDFPAPRPVP